MSDVVNQWKAKSVHDVCLRSDGTLVGLRLPNIRACLIAGGVPLTVVSKMEEVTKANGNGKAPELTLEDLEYDTRFQAEMIRQMVRMVEREAVSLTVEDVAELDEHVRAELWGYASRTTPFPESP